MAHPANMDPFEAMMMDTEYPEHVDPQDLLRYKDASAADNGMPNPDDVMQEIIGQDEETIVDESPNHQLANEMSSVTQADLQYGLSEDASHYLHLYLEAQNMLDQREKSVEDHLKALREAQTDLALKGREARRLQQEMDTVKLEHANLAKLATDREIEINTLQAALKEARDSLAVERDFTKNHNLDQHTHNLKVRLEETVKRHEEEMLKMRDQIAQREKVQTQFVGELTMKHCDAMMGIENKMRQAVAEHEADKNRFIEEKQRCIDRHDEAMGKVQVDLEEAIAQREACVHDLQQALEARDSAISARDTSISERDLVISHCRTVTAQRDEATKQRDQAVSEYSILKKDHDNTIQRVEGLNNLIAKLKLQLNEQLGNSPLHPVSVPMARFKTAPPVSDDIVLAKWKQLYAEIAFLAAELTRCPDAEHLDHRVLDMLRAIIPAHTKRVWEQYMASEDHHKYLMEALIWEIVVNYLENNGVWYGKIGAQFKSLLLSLKKGILQNHSTSAEALMQYSISRAEQVHVIQRFKDATHDLAARNMVIMDVAHQLHPFYPPEAASMQDQNTAYSIHESLEKIFWLAHELDCIFMQSLAHWKPLNGRRQKNWTERMHQIPIWFTDEKAVNARDCPIAFEVAPALRKTGTNYGENFGSSEYLFKGTVVPFNKP